MNKTVDRIKYYLLKVSEENADMNTIKQEFKKEFEFVDPSLILQAEQELIDQHVPIETLSQLCDLHSSLFHGVLDHEKPCCKKKEVQSRNDLELGHPINVFLMENEAIETYLKSFEPWFLGEPLENRVYPFAQFQDIFTHYARKGDLLYPVLKVKYQISGPSDVMWSVDDEIRDGLKPYVKIKQFSDLGQTQKKQLKKLLEKVHEMLYKENNILYPMVLKTFDEEDFMKIYFDMKTYQTSFLKSYPLWEKAEERKEELLKNSTSSSKVFTFNHGQLSKDQAEGILNTLPMELSFVDENNINTYFNDGDKLLKRSYQAIGRNVVTCHPPKIAKMVESILEQFQTTDRKSVDVFTSKNDTPILIRYMKVEDQDGKYLGCLECVLDLTEIEKHYKDLYQK